MKTLDVSVDELLTDSYIFCDSEGMIEDRHADKKIDDLEYDELMTSLESAETKQLVLDWKLEECSETFLKSILDGGIRTPVAVLNGEVLNGHHRIAAAQFFCMNVPVDVYDSWEEFTRLHQWDRPGLVNCWGEKEC